MRKLIVSEFTSLDGVMQAPGGVDEDTDGGFSHGGWTLPYWHDDIGMQFFQSISRCDAFLLGRKTWQEHGEAFEPMAEGDPFGDVMNRMRKYVVSTTLTSVAAWRNSTLISRNVLEEVRKLKQQPGLPCASAVKYEAPVRRLCQWVCRTIRVDILRGGLAIGRAGLLAHPG